MSWLVALKTEGRFAGAILTYLTFEGGRKDCQKGVRSASFEDMKLSVDGALNLEATSNLVCGFCPARVFLRFASGRHVTDKYLGSCVVLASLNTALRTCTAETAPNFTTAGRLPDS